MSDEKAPTHEHVDGDVSDMFFNSNHEDIIPAKKDKVETDHLGYSVDGLKAKASGFVESLKRMGANAVPTVEGLIKDFHRRH